MFGPPGSNPLGFDVAPSGHEVVLNGKWQTTFERVSAEVPRVNSVRIECYRASAICVEFLARMVERVNDPILDRPFLFANVQRYSVIEWTESHIVARAEPRAADVELRIAMLDKTAERTSRETSVRGATSANPTLVDHWVLR